MILVKISMNATIEKKKEIMQTLLSMIKPSKSENGCLNFEVYQNAADESLFCLLEEWDTRDDLVKHLNSSLFSALLGTKGLLTEPPKIQFHTVSKSEGIEAVERAVKIVFSSPSRKEDIPGMNRIM